MANKNVCQYWNEKEPVQCTHWKADEKKCGFEPTPEGTNATYAPDCNRIGTALNCNKYEGEGEKARCILPDPSRHVCNRKTGQKWLIEQISGYNDGKCDGSGTTTTCAGYSPYHMAFGLLKPTKDEAIDSEGFAKIDEIGYRLPLNFDVFNLRAKLSRCYWWKADTADFVLNTETNKVELYPPEFKCESLDEATDEFADFKWDDDLGMNRAPCNGCKPECPGYTGICWEYCIDEKMRQGDKVLAEQILELRYYIRKDDWDPDVYEKSFIEPNILAWAGKVHTERDTRGYETNWMIDGIDTSISDFENFEITRKKMPLTAGTKARSGADNYPHHVREIKDIRPTPIIRNKFDQYDNGNIFEVTKLKHKYIRIFGDVFYYSSEAYGINLNDPDLKFLSIRLKEHNSMAEIEATWDFDAFYKDLECVLENLMKKWPEKVAISGVTGENSFYMNVETFFGANEIIVFDKGSGTWEYDKISVTKLLCNGVIGQTKFSVEGSGGLVSHLPGYENNFASYANKNGSITFEFFPFVSLYGEASVSYIYNDGVRKRLSSNPMQPPPMNDTYELGYKLFEAEFLNRRELYPENFRIFGNAGWILLTLPDEDKKLCNAIKPWDIKGDIILKAGGDDIEMEIVDGLENIDKLEINQMIIKPKNVNQIRQICKDDFLLIGPIYIYEKRSFGQTPADGEEIRESFIAEDDIVSYTKDVTLEEQDNGFELKGFGYRSLMISVVFKGITGRIRGQTKTKMITWVRQPYCRDVEISYSWSAAYSHQRLIPETYLWQTPGIKVSIDPVSHSCSPGCGDHDAHPFRGFTGAMWYPYEECDDIARYNLIDPRQEATYIMEIFGADWPEAHGSWDMRMLGPADSFGFACGTHAMIWECTSDWSFCNDIKTSGNIFTGWGRYRGGLDAHAKFKCTFDGGDMLKFGNPIRDFLRTFRSVDNIDYYFVNMEGERVRMFRRRKWVPVPEFYTTADVTADIEDHPYWLYSSNDYYNDHASFVHPMGLMLADESMEGVSIEEKISPMLWRYRFDEVFRPHFTVQGIYYPMPRKLYYKEIDDLLYPIISWYTYKDDPLAPGGPGSIQWAWQETWKDLERHTFDITDMSCTIVITLQDDCPPVGPYKFVCDDPDGCSADSCIGHLEGRHVFLDIKHPDYRYDYMLGEHRLVCDEGNYTIYLIPPDYKNYSGVTNTFFWLSLDFGPERPFDPMTGAWDPPGSEIVKPIEAELYKYCTTGSWAADITLFAFGYNDPSEEVAEADGRMILTYDENGQEVKTYYQRGLNVSILSDKLDNLPALIQPVLEGWQIMFRDKADCIKEDSNIFWANIEVDEWYEYEPCLEVRYCCGVTDGGSYIEIEYHYIAKDVAEDHGAICQVDCQFVFGAEELESEEGEEEIPLPGNVWFGDLYHIPGVEVYTSADGEDYSLVYSSDEMTLATRDDDRIKSETKSYNWTPGFNEMEDSLGYIKIKFRISPTQEEIDATPGLGGHYSLCANMIWLECIHIYRIAVIEAQEDITTWERKYNISTGGHGDFPPHGYDSTGSLLYVLPPDRSTVYQKDLPGGVLGMPNSGGKHETMNKCRGRIMFECHEDKEPLDIVQGGGWVEGAEKEQQKIHDAIAGSGSTTFKMTSTPPPGLQDYLYNAGVGFPKWICEFKNSLVLMLAPVIPRASFSPCGQEYIQDWSKATKGLCGGFPMTYSRFHADIFEYVFRSACGEGFLWHADDAITAYVYGMGQVLQSTANYMAADMSRADRAQEYLKSINSQVALQAAKERLIQEPVDSVF